MSNSKATARAEIEKLVRYFEQNIHQLKAPNFNEAQARQFLIDPFFEALGWDISNKAMAPPFRLEVLPEGRVKTAIGKADRDQASMFPTAIGVKEEMREYSSMLEYIADDEYKAEHKMASKKPDYRFRIQGATKFFVEAKKPSVDLTSHDSVFQIKRYGFSARVPVSILTDFEEFRVFDCTRKPFYDKPKVGVLKEFDLTYSSYLDAFDLLYDTFSREAVVGGSIEALQKKYLEKKKGEFALDRAFLDDLSEWRVELAQDIAKHPKNRRILNSFTLNECVQRILDRIVFLRVVQDRNIDPDEELLALTRLWDSHPGLSLYEMFNKLIEKKRPLYNGLLFAAHECEQLEIGNKILEKIFKNINYPLSPYNFDEIGVEILGSIYERFLGKTIRLTQKQVRVEDKPEVRKAGGVYYTPQYIVNYIVENTVGRLLYDLTPPQLASGHDGGEVEKLKLTPKQISKLKIIDIACGSGSFLLGAFQKLIDYHEQWYTQHPDDVKEVHGVRDVYEDAHGRLVLSARKKREILVNNIYGVDIDAQAVEVTQMSLYLKVLENENDATLNKPTMLALHEVLLPPLRDNIKCGNSLIGTDIGAQGDLFGGKPVGADGRPPLQQLNPFDWATEFKEIMDAGGFDCVIGNPPWGATFTKAEQDYLQTKFVNRRGESESHLFFLEMGLTCLRAQGILGFITPNTWLAVLNSREIRSHLLSKGSFVEIDELTKYIFDDAPDIVPILVFLTRRRGANAECRVRLSKENKVTAQNFAQAFSEKTIPQSLWEKDKNSTINLRLSTEVNRLCAKLNSKSVPLSAICDVLYGIKTGDNDKYVSKRPTRTHKVRALKTGELARYRISWKGFYLWWTKELAGYRESTVELSKIVVQYIRKLSLRQRIVAAMDDEGVFYPLNNYSYLTLKENSYSLAYVLGIMNSPPLNYYYGNTFVDYNIKPTYLQQLPIRTIDFKKPDEKKMHDDLVKLVEKMLDLHKRLQKASFDSEKEPIQRQIEATDRKIDELVYKLYELTEEEIAIVEGRETEEPGIEKKWEASFASSQEKLEELAGKALKEYKSGKTKKMGFDEL